VIRTHAATHQFIGGEGAATITTAATTATAATGKLQAYIDDTTGAIPRITCQCLLSSVHGNYLLYLCGLVTEICVIIVMVAGVAMWR